MSLPLNLSIVKYFLLFFNKSSTRKTRAASGSAGKIVSGTTPRFYTTTLPPTYISPPGR